jgi:hypothetical protein
MITPGRKLELALGGMVAAVAGLVTAVVAVVRRTNRRRSTR